TCRAFLVRGSGGVFLGATPEILCTVEGDQVQADALAGSARPEEAEALPGSGKDLREHRWVVDHIARALSGIAEHVHRPPDPRMPRPALRGRGHRRRIEPGRGVGGDGAESARAPGRARGPAVNFNLVWAGALADELALSGVRHAVICPGSRSGPLALALAERVRAHTVVDERSAAFFALGAAKASGRPVAVLSTSGTAGAHFYPALLEAEATGVPIIAITADRPPELHGWGAPQPCRDRKSTRLNSSH